MTELANLPYPYLRLWHRHSGSFDYYIRNLVGRAQESKAPADALFQRHNGSGPTGEWACFSDLAEDHPFRKVAKDAGLDG